MAMTESNFAGYVADAIVEKDELKKRAEAAEADAESAEAEVNRLRKQVDLLGSQLQRDALDDVDRLRAEAERDALRAELEADRRRASALVRAFLAPPGADLYPEGEQLLRDIESGARVMPAAEEAP
jgi:predicted nuclease with TOPRIM domain